MWYMFWVQCEELRINHLTPLLVVAMPYACWFLWQADSILRTSSDVFIFNLGLRFEGLFWEGYKFEGLDFVWRALNTSILNIALDGSPQSKNVGTNLKPFEAHRTLEPDSPFRCGFPQHVELYFELHFLVHTKMMFCFESSWYWTHIWRPSTQFTPLNQ